MSLRRDIWRPAIIPCPLPEIVARGTLDGLPLHWIGTPEPHRFLADPFGLWRDDRLHLFCETYDYRDRHGRIRWMALDQAGTILDVADVLAEPWHLSYPFLIEEAGETWMLPEAFRSGALHLYRAAEFPRRWERTATLDLPHVAIDATPVRWNGRWWLFHSAAGSKADKVGTLHLAFADRLEGPWRMHPENPVRRTPAGARPGGTPVVVDGRLALPMQDCRRTYGGAIRWLFVEELTPTRCVLAEGPHFAAPAAARPFTAGLHTMAAAGEVTLVDAKRIDRSLAGLAIDLRRRFGARGRRHHVAEVAEALSGRQPVGGIGHIR